MKENGQLHQIKKKWEMTKPDCSPLRQQAQCSKIQKLYYNWVFWLKLTLFWKSQKRIPMMPNEAIKK